MTGVNWKCMNATCGQHNDPFWPTCNTCGQPQPKGVAPGPSVTVDAEPIYVEPDEDKPKKRKIFGGG